MERLFDQSGRHGVIVGEHLADQTDQECEATRLATEASLLVKPVISGRKCRRIRPVRNRSKRTY